MGLRFRGSWRSYQKRILESLEFHLVDEKLHIVAAPGAGKTTLGIEVLSRLNRPALVLCPTNTIKNQWKDRICSSFLDESEFGIVSTNIREPKFITVITYQALLAAFTGVVEEVKDKTFEDESEDEEDIATPGRFNANKAQEIIKILKEMKISVLCFDEAHHLRKEWWKALTYLVNELEPKQTVALTATPPYDVDYSEWERYEELCGPIDEVISIPELVKNDDLCPHQDFIYFSSLRKNERELIFNYSKKTSEFLNIIKNDNSLIEYLSRMDIWDCSGYDIEKILDNPDFYVSIASLLKTKGIKISKKFLDLFGAREFELPSFNISQAKVFLNGFLITNTGEFVGLERKIESYLNLAKKSGLIQKKKIVLDESTKIQKQMANSLGKLDSIVEITNVEYSSLKSDLRMVILADYIKANDVDNSHLGVVPIWRVLKNKFANIPIGILSGSLIVLPHDVQEKFYKLLDENSLAVDCVSIVPYKEDGNFIKITPKDSVKHCIVSLVTEMFESGSVNVLVGTQALLGEGWDAPCINSLILSSTVSSYMLSNQMRGRAIRKDKKNPDKISNIWHLATLSAPKNDFSLKTLSDIDLEAEAGNFYDLEQLKKRFEGFEAPSYYGNNEIMSGISRVLPKDFFETFLNKGDSILSANNQEIITKAQDRAQTKRWWNEALYFGYGNGIMKLSTGVDTPKLTARSLCYKGYKFEISCLIAVFVVAIAYVIQLRSLALLGILLIVMAISFGVIGVRYLRTGSIAGVMKQVAIVHLETLSYLGLIKTSLKNVGVYVDNQDSVYVGCHNLPTEENNLLIKCMQEFLDPVNNPRYILVKRGNIATQVDYFAIPSVMSSRKKDVEVFKDLWNRYIGKGTVVYTRNYEGRKLLLKARQSAFSASKRKKSEKLSKWQ